MLNCLCYVCVLGVCMLYVWNVNIYILKKKIYKEYVNVLIFWNIIVMILFVCKILVNYNKSVLFFGVRVSLVLFFV